MYGLLKIPSQETITLQIGAVPDTSSPVMAMARAFGVSAALALLGLWALAQGLPTQLPYSGGYTFLHYEFRVPGERPFQWILEVIPKNDSYHVKTSFIREIPASEGFSLVGVYAGVLDVDAIPLMPVFYMWDKEIEPGKSYFLRKGARLITEKETEILGIPVVTGIYLHPDHSDLRTVVYIPRLSHRPLLIFPPYLRLEKKEGNGWSLVIEVELVEFEHEG